ncbi:EAL and HDOD domain-containing protein [Desulfovibrio sp. JC010]|uniref:EAL and HDOD domain-containing protein n=1 Tax=Desulfovibrio sp. JC010 TaxID=2593641 RepID=UPI0013D7BAE8|nr:HDOD domain-containing protein [Desulfovibrio sp. JC010]NDV27876.1 HDOD domain-containing protein [Desulfovibrio sp. JC010]
MPGKKPLYDKIFFARQPILMPDQSLWGYELLFRGSSEATSAEISDSYKATLRVAADLCAAPGEKMPDNVKLVVNFSHKAVMDKIPYSLPAGKTVVQIPETTPPTPNLIKALQELSKDGYYIAIDDFEARPQGEFLIAYADAIIVDILSADEEKLNRICDLCKEYNTKVIAKRVENNAQYNLAQKMGFNFFQGFYFKKPENIKGRKLRSGEIVKLKLLKLIEDPSPDFKALADALQNDVSISFRLLTLLNSPTFGFSQKITSIKQALVLAGWKMLKNWLRVILLTDLTPEEKSRELPQLATQRAKFLQLVALRSGKGLAPDSMFLLGLFSLLGAMFDMSMKELTSYLPLEEEINDALCGEDNIYNRYLELTSFFEAGDWDNLEFLLGELDLDPVQVSKSYYESTRWANSFFQIPGTP